MKTMLTVQEFSKWIVDDNFVLKTQRQIVKDFYSSDIHFSDSFEDRPMTQNQILTELETRIQLASETNKLSQLLYQIDVPEELYINLLNSANFHRQLSELILYREAYKVYLRSRF